MLGAYCARPRMRRFKFQVYVRLLLSALSRPKKARLVIPDRVQKKTPGRSDQTAADDRSEDNKRTRARGTEITGGMASEGEWTPISPAKRQVAAIEMRVGQQGGPLPFEAISASGEPIVNSLHGGVTATGRDALRFT